MEEIDGDLDRREPGFRLLRIIAVAVLVIVVTAGSSGAMTAQGAAGGTPRGEGRTAAAFIGPVAVPGGGTPPATAAAPAGPVDTVPTTTTRTALAAFTTALPDGRARVAIDTAMAQIGLPYVWGGDGPAAGDAGFDCSGLTTFSYRAAGVTLPRTAHTQYYAGPHVPAGAPLQPGDLVFYGTPSKVHHVGMYIGAGRMVNAPSFGKPVRTAYYRWIGDDYLGATRPAATGRPTTGVLPVPAPAPTVPDTAPALPPVFAAPPAPLPVTPLPAPTDPQPPESVTAADAIGATGSLAATGQPTPAPATSVPAPATAAPAPAVETTAPVATAPPTPSPPATATPPPTTPTTPGPTPTATPAVPPPTTAPPRPSSSPTRSVPPPTSTSPPPPPRNGVSSTPTATPTPTPAP